MNYVKRYMDCVMKNSSNPNFRPEVVMAKCSTYSSSNTVPLTDGNNNLMDAVRDLSVFVPMDIIRDQLSRQLSVFSGSTEIYLLLLDDFVFAFDSKQQLDFCQNEIRKLERRMDALGFIKSVEGDFYVTCNERNGIDLGGVVEIYRADGETDIIGGYILITKASLQLFNGFFILNGEIFNVAYRYVDRDV